MAIINSININMNQVQFAVDRPDRTSTPVVRPTDAETKADAPKSDPLPPQQKLWDSHLALGQRQTSNSSLNEAAISVRTADKTMKTIGAHIKSMRSQLDIIVKHYPPFLSSSPDRIKALRSFSAFRREIDELSVPPADSGAAKIMADPQVFPTAGNQTIPLANGGSGVIKSQQVHTGPTGINIPALTEGATDAEINTAIKSLDAAQNTIGQRQAGLSMDWAVIVPTGKYADAAVEQKSVELGKTIAQNAWQGFTAVLLLLAQLA